MAVVGGGGNLQEAREPLILEHNSSRIGWLACNSIGPAFAFANDNPERPMDSGRARHSATATGCGKHWVFWRRKLIWC